MANKQQWVVLYKPRRDRWRIWRVYWTRAEARRMKAALSKYNYVHVRKLDGSDASLLRTARARSVAARALAALRRLAARLRRMAGGLWRRTARFRSAR